MGASVDPSDSLARCLQFAIHFDGDRLTEAHLFGFNQDTTEDGTKRESLVLLSLATPADVHAFGCESAKSANERRGDPPPEKRRYYCGYKAATAGALTIDRPTFRTEIEHCPENGFEAHAEIILRFKVQQKNERAQARTEAGMLIAHALGPAVPHICHDAENDDYHPLKRFGPDCLELRAA